MGDSATFRPQGTLWEIPDRCPRHLIVFLVRSVVPRAVPPLANPVRAVPSCDVAGRPNVSNDGS